MTDNEKLETLMSAGVDAEAALRNDLDADEQEEPAVVIVAEHLACLACSDNVEDAMANVNAALAAIDGSNMRKRLRGVRAELKAGLTEVE